MKTTLPEQPKVLRLPDGRVIRSVRVFIHQPKLRDEPFEHVYSIAEILALAARFRSGAASVENAIRHHKVIAIADWNRTYLNPNPNDEDCAFCRAIAVCPSAAEKVRKSITPLGAIEDLDEVPVGKAKGVPEQRRAITSRLVPGDMEHLNAAMKATAFIEDWCLAVRAEMERRLLAGESAEDFGLELGRKGARAFKDPEAVTNMLRKTFRLKEKDVFNFKLKTPTQLEDLTKPVIEADGTIIPPLLGEKRWARINALVSQGDPKPSVKPKGVIKTPYTATPPEPLAAIPDEDEDDNLA
jgi:hypothetical protein